MLGAIAGGVLGAIAGGQGNRSSGTSSSSTSVNLRDINDLNKGRSALEGAADTASLDQFNQLLSLVSAGPGASAITQSLDASNNYATMLQNLLNSGGMANSTQIGQAQDYASQIFAPQQLALTQQFDDQRIQAQRMAARLGRPGTDPILANKLAQEQTRQRGMLNSQQGAFAADFANQLPGRQLGLAEGLMNVRGGLASQAFQNRQLLLQLGNQLTQSERNYRLQSAGRSETGSTSSTSGGGLAGAIGGGLAGFGAGSNPNVSKFFGDMGSSISGLFSKPAPSAPSPLAASVGRNPYISNQGP